MKYMIVLCLILGLLIAGCGNVAQNKDVAQNKNENPAPTSPITPQVTEEEQPEETIEATPPAEKPADEGGSTGTVVILAPQPVETFDPYLMKNNQEDSVAAHLWETLLWINDDLALEPRLAESWRLVNDTTWEFKLRQDVTFHNGQPFDAAAAKFSIERAAQLVGGLESFAAEVDLQQVEIVDDHTIQLVTAKSDVSAPYQLASVEMLPPDYYGTGEDWLSLPVGSGPYRFLRQEDDNSVILEANPNYWQGPPALSSLIFRSVADPVTRVTHLLDGKAQLVSDLPPDLIAALETDDVRSEVLESTRRLFIGMRVETNSPLSDKQVRQALNYAIDVDSLVDSLAGGYGQRYGSWVNPPHNLDTLAPWPYDPAKARELLAAAGYPDGFQIELDTPLDRYYQDQAISDAIAEQLAQVGVRVQVQPYEWPTYVSDRLIPKETSPLFLLGIASRGNGLEDTANLAVDFPFNPTLWRNVEFERLVAEARSTFNDAQHQALLNQAQAIAYEESPWLWLWRPYDFYGVASWLDWQPRADGLIYLYKAKVSDQ